MLWLSLLTITVILSALQLAQTSARFVTAGSLLQNSVTGQPEVLCGADAIALKFQTTAPFSGKVFVKGFASDPNCVELGIQKTESTFSIPFDMCGVRRERKIFITKIDKAYKISCFYTESSKSVNQQLDIAALTTQLLENTISMPTCKYEILTGGPSGQIAQYAKIGDTVYHKWSCSADIEDVYCMRVHTCTVVDGQGGDPVPVLDSNGCQIDDSVLRNLDYTGDLTAGQEAMAFKFADKSGLYFNCQIQLTLKDRQFGCTVSQPDCSASGANAQIAVEAAATQSEAEYSNPPYAPSPPPPADASPSNLSPLPSPPDENYPQPPAVPDSGIQTRSSSGPPGVTPSYLDMFDVTTVAYDEANVSPSASYDKAAKKRRDVVADFDLPQTSLLVFGLEDEMSLGEAAPSLPAGQCLRADDVWLPGCVCLLCVLSVVAALLVALLRQRALLARAK